MVSVDDLLQHAGLSRQGSVRWEETAALDGAGVYILSTSNRADSNDGLQECPLDLDAVSRLLKARPEATVDGVPARIEKLSQRLRHMWVPQQSAIYIGMAGTSVRGRVRDFYATKLGARAPHSGGWPIKMLRSESLWVHYAASRSSSEAKQAEIAMLKRFADSVTPKTSEGLVDPLLPIPFANLTMPSRGRKRHGIAGVREKRETRTAVPSGIDDKIEGAEPAPRHLGGVGEVRKTQNITNNDLSRGQIRVPRVSKDVFPTQRSRICVVIDDSVHEATWDPQTTGQKERSGVIRLGGALLDLGFRAGGPRTIVRNASGYVITPSEKTTD